MGKVICDICGTSYSETAAQCPICGSANAADMQAILSDNPEEETASASGYTYVKGGRFSNSNVRKRAKTAGRDAVRQPPAEPRREPHRVHREEQQNRPVQAQHKEEPAATPKRKGANRGLVITVVILLLLVIAAAGYIAVRFFLPVTTDINSNGTSAPITGENSGNEEPPILEDVPCLGITVDQPMIELNEVGQTYQINIIREPVNTTDEVEYESSDPRVAEVSDTGVLTAVASGRAIITIRCGDVSAQCAVTCIISETTTDPEDEFALNRDDITFNAAGETWRLYDGSIGLTLIKWTSDDEKVATVENGLVTAVGPGITTIYAEYENKELRCVVRCEFEEEETTEPTEDPNVPVDTNCSIKTEWGSTIKDITMRVGEKLNVYLVDSSGNRVKATWTVSGDCLEIGDNYIKALSSGKVTLTATYGGKTFECIVRIN